MSAVTEKSLEPNSLRYGEPTWEVAHLVPLQGMWSESEYLALETTLPEALPAKDHFGGSVGVPPNIALGNLFGLPAGPAPWETR